MSQSSGSTGQTRNPTTVLLISFICAPYAIFAMFQMFGELGTYLGKSIPWWQMFIPVLNLIFLFSTLPKLVAEAKQKAGSTTPVRGAALYFLVGPYALAADLNDVWNPRGLPA